jgi:predicted Co/Zn/Cd cation transporter (cation efflux family)
MADLFVKIDELVGYAASFAALASDSEAASTSFVQGFAAFANAWGNDAPGAAFFGVYADPAADTLSCAQQVPVQLSVLGTAMADTADAYVGTELANTDLAGGAATA